MTTTDSERIRGVVVGYDGSDAGAQAIKWAAEEATVRRVPLTVMHIWESHFGGSIGMAPVDFRSMAQETLENGVELVRKTAPGVEIGYLLENGLPAARLVDVSGRADMIVVGSRGLGGFTRLVLGSVGAQVAAYAACPVVVVRDTTGSAPGEEQGRVVVGVDGSAASRAAMDLAFMEADAHRAPLTAVVAWDPAPEIALPPLVDEDGMREAAEARLARLLAPLRERHPKVMVRTRIMPGPPRQALMDASAGARLVVVGSRGLGGFRGLLLGSVSHALVHHAPCSVAVVHGPAPSPLRRALD